MVDILPLFKTFLSVLSPTLSYISSHSDPELQDDYPVTGLPTLQDDCSRARGGKGRNPPQALIPDFCNPRQVCKGHLVTVIHAANHSEWHILLHPPRSHFSNPNIIYFNFFFWMSDTLQTI